MTVRVEFGEGFSGLRILSQPPPINIGGFVAHGKNYSVNIIIVMPG